MIPEEQAISKLRAISFQIDDDKIVALEEFFHQLREIDNQVSCASTTKLYESQWALLGIVSRSYQLMLCCIEQIAGGNWNGFYACARGLTETLCSIVWASDIPERLPELVRIQKLNNGKMLNAGYRKYPEIKGAYSFLSDIVHPSRDSHLLGFWPTEERGEKGVWSPFTLTFSDCFAAQKIDLLVVIGPKINQELMKLLAQDADVVKQGRVMTQLGAAITAPTGTQKPLEPT